MPVSHARSNVRSGSSVVKMRPFPRRAPERARSADRVGLTAARTSGVGTPTPADDTGNLPTAALVREAVDTALVSLESLEHQARDVARRFRRRALDDAQLGLSHLVQSTQTLLRLAAMAADASGTDLETLCESHGIPAASRTNDAVSDLIRGQMAGDWHGMAAVIEKPYVAALAAWRAVFQLIGGPSGGPYGHAA